MKSLSPTQFELIRKFEQTYWENLAERNRLGAEVLDSLCLTYLKGQVENIRESHYEENLVTVDDKPGRFFWLTIWIDFRPVNHNHDLNKPVYCNCGAPWHYNFVLNEWKIPASSGVAPESPLLP